MAFQGVLDMVTATLLMAVADMLMVRLPVLVSYDQTPESAPYSMSLIFTESMVLSDMDFLASASLAIRSCVTGFPVPTEATPSDVTSPLTPDSETFTSISEAFLAFLTDDRICSRTEFA